VWAAFAAAPPAADLDAAIEKHRKGTLVIRAAPGAKISVEQLKHDFWFGATLPGHIFTGKANPETAAKFKEVFLDLFNAGVIESAFKWHDMERERGKVDYSVVDAMLSWSAKEQLPLRGHCIFWGVPNRVQPWVKDLDDENLRLALSRRGRSVAARYRNEFAEYDLNNEMIHANYYEQRLGPGITKDMALWVKDGDPKAKLYVNDYDITTGKRLDDYARDIKRLLEMGVPLAGIGVQGHLHGDTFDPAALQHSLDTLAQFKLPIRITEFNFPGQRSKVYGKRDLTLTDEEEQAKAVALKQFFQICFAHPSVTGIMMWGFWEGANWIPQSSLFKRDWTPLPAAAAYRQLVKEEWWTRWNGAASKSGSATVKAFYGTHRITADGKTRIVTLKPGAAPRTIDFR
jgi:GH35 family endo-1,4-beta-xylanase